MYANQWLYFISMKLKKAEQVKSNKHKHMKEKYV